MKHDPRQSLPAILVLAALTGCQSTTPAEPSAPQPLLFTSEVDPSGPESERLTAQLARLDAPACRQTRLRQAPDLAHELFVRSTSPALRAEAARSLEDTSYLVSEAARARSPEAHDLLRAGLVTWIDDRSGDPRRLATGFADLGDLLLQIEVLQRAHARGIQGLAPAGPEAALTSPVQRARRAWLELVTVANGAQPSGDQAALVLSQARAVQHLGILDALDSLCAASALLLPATERNRLATDRARVALVRRDGARALRPAMVALRGAMPGVARVKARLLLARAQLAAGEREAALAEAQSASEEALEAGSKAEEARALGLLGAIFLGLGKAEAAASSYERALAAAHGAGQANLAFRQGLNLTTALLRAGRLNAARAALSKLRAEDPTGPERAELIGQRQVTRALVGLVGGELRPADAADQVEEALRAARAVGCAEIVERYAALPARLRGARPSGS